MELTNVSMEINDDYLGLLMKIKKSVQKLDTYFKAVNNREMMIALTNLEQANMWATKAIIVEDERVRAA